MGRINDKKFSVRTTAYYSVPGVEDYIEVCVEDFINKKSSSTVWSITCDKENTYIKNRLGVEFKSNDFGEIMDFVTEYGMKWL